MPPMLLLLLSLGCGSGAPPNVATAADPALELKAPEPQDFVFGPGDVIDIKVWRHEDLDLSVTVAPDGAISFPLLGRIVISGLTYPELIQKLEVGLAEYVVEPAVAVNIVQISNQKVFVLGEVQNPAVLQITTEMSILEALIRTGGIHADSRTSNVLLIRGSLDQPELFLVDVDAIYGKGDKSQLVQLQKGDIVYVPTKTIVNVERFFKRVSGILGPFVGGSVIYRNSENGNAQGASSVLD
jgi:polysaccharide export outer membrane protein